MSASCRAHLICDSGVPIALAISEAHAERIVKALNRPPYPTTNARVKWLKEGNAKLAADNARLWLAVANQTGDNLCWYNENVPKVPPREEFLESCSRYHAQMAESRGVLTGCMTIAQLEADNARLHVANESLRAQNELLAARLHALEPPR